MHWRGGGGELNVWVEDGGLALLASGKKEYHSLVRDYARKLGPADLTLKLFGGGRLVSWHWAYANLFLTEYYLASGDEHVLPRSGNTPRWREGAGS